MYRHLTTCPCPLNSAPLPPFNDTNDLPPFRTFASAFALGPWNGVAPSSFGGAGVGAGVGAQLLSVVFVWAPGVAPSSFGGAGVGAGGGAQQLRWCWRGRRGWRPIVSVARGLAPGVAPSSFGGAGVDSGVGAQLLSIVFVWAPGLAPSSFGGAGVGITRTTN